MKRLLAVFLVLTCWMAVCCPVLGAETCTLPQELPGTLEDTAVYDVLILGEAPDENTASDAPVQDAPADRTAPGEMADGKYATMGDLYQAWGGYEGYPDYICGVWSTDGGMDNLTVAVTKDEAGERGKAEILSQLENPGTVTFTFQTYRYSELQQVMDEITAQMGGDSPIVACGVYEMDNNVHVTVNESHEKAQEIALELSQRYTDRVVVELGDLMYTTALEELGKPEPPVDLLPFALLVIVVLTGLLLVKKLPARVTNTGKVVAGGRPSRAQVEAAIAEQTETPPDRVEDRIREQL